VRNVLALKWFTVCNPCRIRLFWIRPHLNITSTCQPLQSNILSSLRGVWLFERTAILRRISDRKHLLLVHNGGCRQTESALIFCSLIGFANGKKSGPRETNERLRIYAGWRFWARGQEYASSLICCSACLRQLQALVRFSRRCEKQIKAPTIIRKTCYLQRTLYDSVFFSSKKSWDPLRRKILCCADLIWTDCTATTTEASFNEEERTLKIKIEGNYLERKRAKR
jgi:hypothetical protein